MQPALFSLGTVGTLGKDLSFLRLPCPELVDQTRDSRDTIPTGPASLSRLSRLVENGLGTRNILYFQLFPECLERPESKQLNPCPTSQGTSNALECNFLARRRLRGACPAHRQS
jgi:hypothetical protein